MKTLLQIHKDHNIAKSTLRHRFKRYGFDLRCLIDEKNEAMIVKRVFAKTTKYLNKINPLLVFDFKTENPYMSNDEIATCLAIPRHVVDEILIGEYFIISSKSNKWQ